MTKPGETVLLTGASGSMGFETFRQLWQKRDHYKLVLLLRPSAKNKRMFNAYEKDSGIEPFAGAGVAQGHGLKIVWGDIQNKEDVIEACRDIDCCLHPMALISPEADRNPDMAHKVNYLGTKNLVEAIEDEDPDRIRFVYIGSVAEYGSRLPQVHMGRTGDPVTPSIHDHYALSKISGELTVMQSRIRHRVSLRQTFIMIPDLFGLQDPIMFHQPVNSFMESITAQDSGRLLATCLEVPRDSDFWGGYYNISGGPAYRTTYIEFLQRIYSMLGLDYRQCMERNWFALQNFHMMFYEDSDRLNQYLHHWEGAQSPEDYYREVWTTLPWYLKMTAWCCKHIPGYRLLIQAVTKNQLKKMAMQAEGTLGWIAQGDEGKINAFFGSLQAQQGIGDWDENMPCLDHQQAHLRLDHGYDESKSVLDTADLQQAAVFRGGSLASAIWDGNMQRKLPWQCAQGHSFEMTPHAVLKGGHWCLACISPPWNYPELARTNPFSAQVL